MFLVCQILCARASVTIYSLIETAKANDLELSRYLNQILQQIASAKNIEEIEALLPWNVDLKQEG